MATRIVDLEDDIIFKIFEYLELDEVIALERVDYGTFGRNSECFLNRINDSQIEHWFKNVHCKRYDVNCYLNMVIKCPNVTYFNGGYLDWYQKPILYSDQELSTRGHEMAAKCPNLRYIEMVPAYKSILEGYLANLGDDNVIEELRLEPKSIYNCKPGDPYKEILKNTFYHLNEIHVQSLTKNKLIKAPNLRTIVLPVTECYGSDLLIQLLVCHPLLIVIDGWFRVEPNALKCLMKRKIYQLKLDLIELDNSDSVHEEQLLLEKWLSINGRHLEWFSVRNVTTQQLNLISKYCIKVCKFEFSFRLDITIGNSIEEVEDQMMASLKQLKSLRWINRKPIGLSRLQESELRNHLPNLHHYVLF